LRFIGLDVHRDFCDVAIYENGTVRSAGRVASAPQQLELFAQSLGPDDRVALETTGNALSIARIIEPHVAAVLVADTRNVRAMTHAKVKNDRVDAQMLAKLLAAGMLPGTWVCDEQTRILRRRIARRSQLVRGRTRARNQIHAVVIRNLGGRAPASDTFGKKGRAWLATLQLPVDERAMVDSCMREADFLSGEIARIDGEIARYALGSAEIRRLMTIPGISVTTAATLMATIGRIDRFPSARHLVGYIGLDPRSRQSGVSPVHHGHILKAGLLLRAPRALRSSARRDACPWPTAGVRCSSSRAPWQQDRDGRRRPQARVPDVAAAEHAAGLHLRTARADVPQAAPARARRRRAEAQQPTCAQQPGDARHRRAVEGRARTGTSHRKRLPHRRRRLAAATTLSSSHLMGEVGSSTLCRALPVWLKRPPKNRSAAGIDRGRLQLNVFRRIPTTAVGLI
jgi:transposase